MASVRIRDLVADPSFLLHQIDPHSGSLVFLPVERPTLEQASFLDGRTPLASGPPVEVPMDEALGDSGELPSGQDRFIFHVSFCGSTLLARILDQPGGAFVLREPNCLVDLANWKTALDRSGRTDDRFRPMVELACASLRARWQAQERVVVKPSNWANNLLAELCRPQRDVLALFVTIDARAFLRAVFRGGRDRVAFTARAAGHLAAGDPAAETLLAAAIRESHEPIGQAANLALLTYHLELRRFRSAMRALRLSTASVTSLEALTANPLAAAQRASDALALGLGPDGLARNIAANLGRNAKQPGAPYSAEEHQRADRAIEQSCGRQIEAALAWGQEYFLIEDLAGAERGGARLAG